MKNIKDLKPYIQYRKNTDRKTLYEDKYISIIQIDSNDHPYTFLHEKRCNGIIIAVLLYKKTNNATLYGVRKETVPPWYDKPIICSLTGGLENGNILETVLTEIKEESGYSLSVKEIKFLDICFGTKSTDTLYFLFCADVTGKICGAKSGDGTLYDTIATFEFLPEEEIIKSRDPILITLYCKTVYVNNKK